MPRKLNSRHITPVTDPVEVCARIRNKSNNKEESCIKVINDTTIHLTPGDSKLFMVNNIYFLSSYQQTECQFSRVFDSNVSQKRLFDCVAQTMVDDLVRGKNGLLFTYGVTSSGKTYTMTGSLEEPGFLPRCLDMLFNSITAVQASKYVFVPDGMNGFHVQSEADALLEKQERDILPQLTPKTPNKIESAATFSFRNINVHYKEKNINPECRYSVFVSYVEIYNDYVYDLLGDVQLDPFNRPKPPQSKRLREDKNKNMFVYGVSQVEVASTEEAFAAFQQGQERRRIAHTQLNAESSRSHSILNIRLVQAPLDPLGEDLLQERSLICASQLSLVDLAGSERMARTGAGGERSREAGNINSSLMTLRRCLEQLRENQKNGSSDMVKYRNSKLTHLFKSYFEGHGKVKMVVCLNPNMAEYDENIHVVQFAEMAQQVEVARSEDFKSFTPPTTLHPSPPPQTDDGESDWESPDYSLGQPFPNLEVMDYADNETVPGLISMLEHRIGRMNAIKKRVSRYGEIFRSNLSSCTQHEQSVQQQLKDCEADLANKTKELNKLDRQVKKLESKNQVLTRTTQVFEKEKKQLQDQLSDAEAMLKSSQSDSRRLEMKMKGAVANTKAHVEKECEKRVRTVQTEMQEKMWVKDERLRQLKNIISTGGGREGRPTAARRCQTPLKQPISSVSSVSGGFSAMSVQQCNYLSQICSSVGLSHAQSEFEDSMSGGDVMHRMTTRSRVRSVVSSIEDSFILEQENQRTLGSEYVNKADEDLFRHRVCGRWNPGPPVATKHRRSCSASHSNWLAHLPSSTVQTETILQPAIRPNKVVNVPSPKDVAGASKYLLTHQREDGTGEIETQLVKGEVFHTRSGGQQVQFVDIETLKQHDPQKNEKKSITSRRKRRSETSIEEASVDEQSSWTDVETRCAYGIGNTNNVAAVTNKRKK
uniref:Kinesin-like protein n=1 Tax=Ciona savignyi TaxID=51511 RepID=H2YQY5_CIOSA